MSSKSLGVLSLDLIVETGGFAKGLDHAERLADKKTRQIERLARERAKGIEDAFSSMARSIAGPLAAAFGAGTFTGMVKGVADAGDQLQKLSSKTGIAVENLSKLQYAGSLADLSTEDLGTSLTKLNRVMGDAANGSKSATEALKRFDIKPGTSALDAFRQIAERVKSTGDETKIASGLNDVFGKSYAALIPLLRGGSEGLKSAGDELERMGGVMSGELAASSEAFNDNITRLVRQIDVLKLEAVGPLIPLFLEISGAMVGTANQSDKLSASGQVLKAVFESVAVVGFNTAYVFKAVGTELGGIAAQIVSLGKGDFDAFSNIGDAMKEDAIAARKEIDALTERLLNPPKIEIISNLAKGAGISDTPAAAAVKAPRLTAQVSEGQRLIDQLRERLLGTQELTEVERLQAQIANARYPKATAGEKAIALGIAEQIDARKNLNTELDAELVIAKKLTAEYDRQDARLKSLVAGTSIGANTQNMLDEALAESSLRSGSIDTSTYDQILEKMREVKDTGKDVFKDLEDAIDGFGKQSASAFVDFCFGAKSSFSSLAVSVLKDLATMGIQKGITGPLFKTISSMAASFFTPNADGGVYNSPSLSAYSGQVVSSPTPFMFAKGMGLMGEAGPEAILPLSRSADGKLGVQGGGSATNVSINLTINEADGTTKQNTSGDATGAWTAFAGKMKAMILEQMVNEKRPGGLLYG